MSPRRTEPRVVILLSTLNGEAYLDAQMDSLLAQTHENWVLFWRDDGSRDATTLRMQNFAARAGQGRVIRVESADGRLGVTDSYLTLLRRVAGILTETDAVAFADQDDVWLPEKLERGLAALRTVKAATPALYCARQKFVDSGLAPLGESERLRRPVGFPAALTQNVATGCTMMLNRAAVALVASSRPAPGTLHDWWCYLVVTAAGGVVLPDETATVLYRQHGGNLVGAPSTRLHRGLAALRRGPAQFMGQFRRHVAALADQPHLLTARAQQELKAIDRALRGGPWLRATALRMPGLIRQTVAETFLFRVWFLIG